MSLNKLPKGFNKLFVVSALSILVAFLSIIIGIVGGYLPLAQVPPLPTKVSAPPDETETLTELDAVKSRLGTLEAQTKRDIEALQTRVPSSSIAADISRLEGKVERNSKAISNLEQLIAGKPITGESTPSSPERATLLRLEDEIRQNVEAISNLERLTQENSELTEVISSTLQTNISTLENGIQQNSESISTFEDLLLSEPERLITLPLLQDGLELTNRELQTVETRVETRVETIYSLMVEADNQIRWSIGFLFTAVIGLFLPVILFIVRTLFSNSVWGKEDGEEAVRRDTEANE